MWRSENSLQEPVLSFLQVGLGGLSQAARLSRRSFYLQGLPLGGPPPPYSLLFFSLLLFALNIFGGFFLPPCVSSPGALVKSPCISIVTVTVFLTQSLRVVWFRWYLQVEMPRLLTFSASALLTFPQTHFRLSSFTTV